MRSVNSGVRPSWAADELHGLLGPVTWELWEPRGCTGEGGTWVAATPATHDNMLGVQPRASPALEPAGGLQDVGTDLMALYTLPQGLLAGPLPLPQL